MIPGITNNKLQRNVNNPTRKFTLKADQKSSKPQKASPTPGLFPAATFKYTLTTLSANAGVIITVATIPPPGINDNSEPAADEINPIIKGGKHSWVILKILKQNYLSRQLL